MVASGDKMYFRPVFILMLLFSFFYSSLALCQSTSDSISFSKKEMAFIKWGQDKNEFGFLRRESKNTYQGIDLGGKKETYYWSRLLKLDGNDNVYVLDGWNKQIFIVSPDDAIKTIGSEKTRGLITVDAFGNIYGSNKKGEPQGFTVTKPDGSQKVYRNFNLNFEENGIVYDLKNKKTLNIADVGDQIEKLPPHLLSDHDQVDFEKKTSDSFVIYTKKINKHLAKINRKIEADTIQIKIEGKNGSPSYLDLIGVDDDGNSYFLCGYGTGNISAPWSDAFLTVYSQEGRKLAEISLDLDYFNKQIDGNELALDVHGNIFQMLASEDGVRILKWSKN